MKLCFDTIDEVKDFVKMLKGTRGGKDKDEEPGQAAPAPLAPPNGQTQGFPGGGAVGFAPPAGGATPGAGAFPAAVVQPSPEVAALVARINARLDAALASGQPAEAALQWVRGQCGPEAATADMNQIKSVFLPRQSYPQLENIAKLMAA